MFKGLLRNIFKCSFNEQKCFNNFFGCKCGRTSKPKPPPAASVKSAEEIANEQVKAQLGALRPAAEIKYNIDADPNIGIQAQTQLSEDARQNVFPNEQAVRSQLVQNILANLISPTGISPEQQTALTSRRGQARGELEQSMRTRANLGGGLYGGRSAGAEARSVGEQSQNFAIEDIDRQDRARMNAISSALPILQLLFPEVGLVQPSFINPVSSPESQLSAYTTGRGQDLTYQAQQEANQNALRAALYQSIGQSAGAAAGAFAACWVASEIFGGWYHPKTCMARYFISNIAPKWFKDFYIEYGERIAKFISDKPILKIMLRPLFEIFVLMGGYKCQTIL